MRALRILGSSDCEISSRSVWDLRFARTPMKLTSDHTAIHIVAAFKAHCGLPKYHLNSALAKRGSGTMNMFAQYNRLAMRVYRTSERTFPDSSAVSLIWFD